MFVCKKAIFISHREHQAAEFFYISSFSLEETVFTLSIPCLLFSFVTTWFIQINEIVFKVFSRLRIRSKYMEYSLLILLIVYLWSSDYDTIKIIICNNNNSQPARVGFIRCCSFHVVCMKKIDICSSFRTRLVCMNIRYERCMVICSI